MNAADSQHQSTVTNPKGARPYMAYHTRGCHRQTDWRTQKNMEPRQDRRMPTTSIWI